MLAVGLMSGTSLDGVDAALVDVSGEGMATRARLVAFETLAMPAATRARVMRACDPRESSTPLVCSLNVELAHLFARAARAVCARAGVEPSELAFVASHGQTVWHAPAGALDGADAGDPACDCCFSSTLQIGEPAVIAYDLGCTVVANFRPADMAAGGQGAPLVPYSEVVLYGDAERNVALLNVGGIGNVTVLPAGCGGRAAGGPSGADGVFAFDTGPGNMMVDEACRRLLGMPYDDGGRVAAGGRVDGALLAELMASPYLAQEPPKSTGRELFGAGATARVLEAHPDLAPADVIATLTEFSVACVADACRRFVEPRLAGPLDRLVVAGGGAHNATLVAALGRLMGATEVLTQEDLGLSSDAKEAVAFVILGNETLHGRPSNVPSATGASRPVILGSVTYPPCAFGTSRL